MSFMDTLMDECWLHLQYIFSFSVVCLFWSNQWQWPMEWTKLIKLTVYFTFYIWSYSVSIHDLNAILSLILTTSQNVCDEIDDWPCYACHVIVDFYRMITLEFEEKNLPRSLSLSAPLSWQFIAQQQLPLDYLFRVLDCDKGIKISFALLQQPSRLTSMHRSRKRAGRRGDYSD